MISFGGGSPIDTAKAALHTLLTADGASPRDEGPTHIAIPTTLSAGEFTAVLGITDEETRVKRAISNARLVPRVVFTDPAVTLETPAWLWAASGVRALDHAVETIDAARQHPLSEAAASRGLAMLLEHLPASLTTTGAEQLEHRLQCQLGAWLSVFGLPNAGLANTKSCGDPPFAMSAPVVTSVLVNGTVPAASLTWGPSVDENAGEKDVERYVVWRRLSTTTDWGDPIVSIPAGSPTYVWTDASVVPGPPSNTYYYAVAAQDCSPALSPQALSGSVSF